MKTLIKNVQAVLPDGIRNTHILLDGETIASVDADPETPADDTVDGKGLHLIPGVIDDQVHFRDPGLTHKEDLRTGSRACAKGGVTTFLEMPNTKGLRHLAFLVEDLEAVLDAVRGAGGQVLAPVQTVPTTQAEFGTRQKWIVYCRDPEGNLLEFCDYR